MNYSFPECVNIVVAHRRGNYEIHHDIQRFTFKESSAAGERRKDYANAIEYLREFGFKEIPEGYVLHHDYENEDNIDISKLENAINYKLPETYGKCLFKYNELLLCRPVKQTW